MDVAPDGQRALDLMEGRYDAILLDANAQHGWPRDGSPHPCSGARQRGSAAGVHGHGFADVETREMAQAAEPMAFWPSLRRMNCLTCSVPYMAREKVNESLDCSF